MKLSVMRIKYMSALDHGNYELAQHFLSQLIEYYAANGYSSAMECTRFEKMVKWFDTNVVEAGLIKKDDKEVKS